ncbi:DUF397 domain-containing protein [Streptomyces sp. NPDC002851]
MDALEVTGYRNNHVPDARWFKSSFSDLDHSKDCVVFTELDDGLIGISDSKDPDAAVLRLSRGEITAFVQGAKAGAFDASTTP